MSEDEKPRIDEKPRRYWATNADDSPRSNYLQVRKMTIGELREHFDVHYPHVDFEALEIGGIQLRWHDAPTEDELAQRERQRRNHDERHAKWERDMFAKLKAKFEPATDPALEES